MNMNVIWSSQVWNDKLTWSLFIGIDGAVIVTTPQEVSLLDVRKEISFCQRVSLPILGVIENMSGFVCGNCSTHSVIFPATSGGAEKLCQDTGILLLDKVPLDPRVGQVNLNIKKRAFDKKPFLKN